MNGFTSTGRISKPSLFLIFFFVNIDKLYEKIDLFSEVLETIEKEYIEEIDQAEVMDSAINGVLQSLDPYSAYMYPEIFLEIVSQSQTKDNDQTYGKLLYYLNRHIELDGDEHGPISLKMVADLCGEDTTKWEEVLETAKDALKFRLKLWDHITEAIVLHNVKEVLNT